MTQAPTAAARFGIEQSLRSGFAAQQQGRLREAAEHYEQVLAQDPVHFDATHMLGVVQYHRGRFAAALRLLTRATGLRPDVVEARGNLEIVETARQRERQLCRAVLPRLRHLVQPIADPAAVLAAAPAVAMVIAQRIAAQDEPFLAALLRHAGGARVRLWAHESVSGVPDLRPTILSAASRPTGGTLLVFGTEFSPGSWLDAPAPGPTLLCVTRDEPGELIDRVRELSGDGRTPIGLVCAGAALAARIPLPARVIVAPAHAESSTLR